MSATIIPFPAPAPARLLPRVAETGDRVMILDEGAVAHMIGETRNGARAVLLHRGSVRVIDFARIWPIATTRRRRGRGKGAGP